MEDKMKISTFRTTCSTLLLVAITVCLVSGQELKADASPSNTTPSLLNASGAVVGSWMLSVSSGGPQPFKALVTFTEGGGVVASAQGDILLSPPPGVPPVATAAHGAWVRTANYEYLFTFRQIFYNADGSNAGGAKIRNSAVVNRIGNEMTGQLSVFYYDASGNEVFAGAGTFTGERIEAEPMNP